ncbi:uncharacterized protein LOC122509368 isoform X2 [Leptopilina heterotoma]|uniref:uncharacterized protein LOC122509368 isoform X2 n=1 Tax=Leptopilina heterotoma TaxID=63436 RepID=UPI001CA8D31F|nr:uncharacterized protein LOC122509368 isoform X2 [Leptopilina heterotoma]
MKKSKLEHVFQKHSSIFKEEQPLLFEEETCEKRNFPRIRCENIISQGAVKFLEKWPSHIYSTFLLGCSIISIILTFILITIFFSFSTGNYRYRETRNAKEDLYNVYFIKHENHTWSRKELCYIETAAHKHPELNIYLINLISEDFPKDNTMQVQFTDMKNLSSFFNFLKIHDQERNFILPKDLSPEMLVRIKIANNNFNVRNIDLPMEQFFKGSILQNVYKTLNNELIEMAARANILWNYPGIALNPKMFNSIDNVEKYFCKSEKMCKLDQDFITEMRGDLQASTVSCHAFAEFFMKEIIKNPLSTQFHVLQNVLNNFCPRINNCSGVKIVNEESNYLTSEISCPVTYPNGEVVN